MAPWNFDLIWSRVSRINSTEWYLNLHLLDEKCFAFWSESFNRDISFSLIFQALVWSFGFLLFFKPLSCKRMLQLRLSVNETLFPFYQFSLKQRYSLPWFFSDKSPLILQRSFVTCWRLCYTIHNFKSGKISEWTKHFYFVNCGLSSSVWNRKLKTILL